MEFKIGSKRKELYTACGKATYAFFPSLLFSSVMVTAALSLGVFFLSKQTTVFDFLNFDSSVNVFVTATEKTGQNPFVMILLELVSFLSGLIKYLPAVITAVVLFLILVSPVYEGSIRWAAFLAEEGESLPVSAILFYFSSFKLYCSCLAISARLFIKKAVFTVLFLFLPSVCVYISLALTGEYYGQYKFAAISLVLSVVWLALAVLLLCLFFQRYSAVRYLFALGSFKKIFRKSREISESFHFELLILKLKGLLNILFLPFIITAPLGLSRIICSNNIIIKGLIQNKKTAVR